MVPFPRFPARTLRARLAAASVAWAMLASVSAFGLDEPPAAASPAPPSVDEVRSTLERYVETRRILSKERLEFARAKQAILDRIELVEREIDSFRTRISETETSLAAARLAPEIRFRVVGSGQLDGLLAGRPDNVQWVEWVEYER
ncbi:MAG: hypothetical protein ACO3ZY_12215, partial [Phycisphaerales bacterium]